VKLLFLFFFFNKKISFTFLIEKIIVIELDKMLSCVKINSLNMLYYTSFESLFQMDSIHLFKFEINRHPESSSILKEKVLKK